MEQERLFARHWVCIGFIDDVAEVGDVRPVSAAGKSLLLVRSAPDEVRVFHNYCRHRGHRLVAEPCRVTDRLVCPYHAWSYGLDGKLVRAPHYHGLDQHASGGDAGVDIALAPVRSSVWLRLVFVDLSGEAPRLEEHLAPLAERWSDYDFTLLRHGVEDNYELAGNWKLAIENFIDFYHVPLVHPALQSYTRMQDCYFVNGGEVFFGQGTYPVTPQDSAVGRLPEFPNLSQETTQRTEALCIFPNLLLTVFNDNLRAILVERDGPGRCRERVGVFFVGEEALDDRLETLREVAVDRFREFNEEDVAVIENLQLAFATTEFDGGHFSPYFDRHVRHFQRLVARWVLG